MGESDNPDLHVQAKRRWIDDLGFETNRYAFFNEANRWFLHGILRSIRLQHQIFTHRLSQSLRGGGTELWFFELNFGSAFDAV